MKYIQGTTEFSIEEASVITIGKFDGLHVGHQKLLQKVMEKKEQGLKAVVFTFDVPPSVKLTGKGMDTLVTNDERMVMLEEAGIDYLVECPFVPEILSMEPEAFIEEILVNRLKGKYIVCGTDCGFGHKRRGNYRLLQALADRYGYQVDVVDKLQYKGRDISSTYVREEIGNGNIELANFLLGYPYTIAGKVAHGNHLGGTILDMPTANIIPPAHKMLPPNGVYVTRTFVDGVAYEGVSNIGTKPTVSNENPKGIETFLFDFEGDLYGKDILVQLLTYERTEKKFASMEDLKIQMHKDVEFGKNFFASHVNPI